MELVSVHFISISKNNHCLISEAFKELLVCIIGSKATHRNDWHKFRNVLLFCQCNDPHPLHKSMTRGFNMYCKLSGPFNSSSIMTAFDDKPELSSKQIMSLKENSSSLPVPRLNYPVRNICSFWSSSENLACLSSLSGKVGKSGWGNLLRGTVLGARLHKRKGDN